MKPFNDTLIVRTEFSNFNQHNFTTNAIFVSSDNLYKDSTALYDDGMHGDSLAGDGIWGGFINPINEEEIYQIGISTNDIQTGMYFYVEDLVRFTTAGPVVIDSVSVAFNSVANIYQVRPYFKNEGQSFTVENLQIILSSEDSMITYISDPLNITSIPPGSTVGTTSNYTVRVDSNFSGTFNFNFKIACDGWLYWIDSEIVNILGVENEIVIPVNFSLYQNYPNPFNPNTKIKYGIPERTFIDLRIYDILGREVELLMNEEQDAGYYEINFNAANLSSGVYFYRLQAGSFIETKKMVLMK